MAAESLIKLLITNNCIKFGEFTLKTGQKSNYYVDLRESTMCPATFHAIVELVKDFIPKDKQNETYPPLSEQKGAPVAIVGIPYGVVPIAAAVAYSCKLAYYPLRKESKDYGVKPDSNLYTNYEHILIEDVMSSGSSVIETIKKISNKKITDLIVIVNRQSGGDQKLKEEYPNIRVHSILLASDILEFYKELKNVKA